ncbi:MAG: DinB family protein [Candidatus Thorarchaeota archaeon]
MFPIEKMAVYLTWANNSIWKIVETLSTDEFEQSLAEGASSIHRRYIHLAEDTWEWFHDWHGGNPQEPDFYNMSRDQLFQFISDYLKKWRKAAENRFIENFEDERDGKVVVISIDEMFFHLVNHFTYHRGQIAMGLKMLGKEVPMTDYVPYRFTAT